MVRPSVAFSQTRAWRCRPGRDCEGRFRSPLNGRGVAPRDVQGVVVSEPSSVLLERRVRPACISTARGRQAARSGDAPSPIAPTAIGRPIKSRGRGWCGRRLSLRAGPRNGTDRDYTLGICRATGRLSARSPPPICISSISRISPPSAGKRNTRATWSRPTNSPPRNLRESYLAC